MVRKAFPALSPNFAPETPILFQVCLLENNESTQYFPEESEQLPRKPEAALAHTGHSALTACGRLPALYDDRGPREAHVGRGVSAFLQRGQRKVRLPNKHLDH